MKNIVLIGMPGAGKSTIGVILAKALGYGFIDSDLLIQERERRLLPRIIEEEGLERFIQIENEVNESIGGERSIIATGGSAVYGKSAMEHFRETAVIVYLRLEYEELERRVGDPRKRGVVLKEEQSFQDLYQERCPLYEKYAHIIVECEGFDVGELMLKIKNSLLNSQDVLYS